MEYKITSQSDHETPQFFGESQGPLYFSKKSPFKETCNEDAVAVFKLDGGWVLAVADGAGGHPKGEEAAALVLNNLKNTFESQEFQITNLRTHIIDALERTNKELINSGIGARTTVTICEIVGNVARGYQVGDSTLIICGQRGKIKYRSTSHSPVGYGIEAGLIDEKEALDHPDLHFISNLVGEYEMKIEIGPEIELNPYDSIFIASDGIFDNFHGNEVIEIVRKGTITEIGDSLMKAITQQIYNRMESKKDDISFIVFKND